MCGTCSRAREVPVAHALRSQGAPQPAPLRDALHPLGLPNLSTLKQQRVDAANTVYRHAVRLLHALFRVGAFITLENPLRSWLVLATLVKQYAREHKCPEFAEWYFCFHPVEFDFCMHGGTVPSQPSCWCRPDSLSHWGLCATSPTTMSHGQLSVDLISGFFLLQRKLNILQCSVIDMLNVQVQWSLLMHWSITQNFFDCNL